MFSSLVEGAMEAVEKEEMMVEWRRRGMRQTRMRMTTKPSETKEVAGCRHFHVWHRVFSLT
jgi:hypothetical protein